ncbi:MAG TPA: hypothetical protein VFG10_19060 [Saprospiraceae bacterium]|nr:hypothetical protein [Saprospiraceae bacterium]
MNIKNYTSEVPASRSMAHIEDLLVQIGASNINKSYHEKVCSGITFLFTDPKMGPLAFRLKAQVDEAFNVLFKEVKKPIAGTKERVLAQANRTAWKILSDWTEVQCSMIILGQAEALQMFLPFVYDVKNDETLYDKVASGKLNLRLQSPPEKQHP